MDIEPEIRKYYETEYADGDLAWEHFREAGSTMPGTTCAAQRSDGN